MGGVSTDHLRRRAAQRQSRLGAIWSLSLCASLLAGVTALADDSRFGKSGDRISVQPRGDVLELSWSDTEERLQGAIQPDKPIEGEPVKILLNVGSFEGAAFEGPLTVTLREAGATHGETRTVKKGAVNWHTEFTPERPGNYQLDVSFRTTRLKVLHADFTVTTRPVPRFVLWAMVGLAATAAVGYGLRSLLRKDKPAEPLPAEDQRAESKPAEAVPAESKPAEASSSEAVPAKPETPEKPPAL